MSKEKEHKIFVLPLEFFVDVAGGKMVSHPVLVNNKNPKLLNTSSLLYTKPSMSSVQHHMMAANPRGSPSSTLDSEALPELRGLVETFVMMFTVFCAASAFNLLPVAN